MKEYHVSFEIDGAVHGIKVWASSEESARQIAKTRMQVILRRQFRDDGFVLLDDDVCAVELN